MKFIDLTGQKFGRLTVIERESKQDKAIAWLCRCDCGKNTVVKTYRLRNGHTSSCGCLKSKNAATHGMTGQKIYNIWRGIIHRCTNPKSAAFYHYGGRGITVCDRWLNSPEAFLSDMGEPPDGCQIDRIDNNKGYEPTNCRWVTKKENQRNKRNNILIAYKGRTMPLAELAEIVGVNYSLLKSRLDRGWSIEKAINTPKVKPGHKS